MSQTRRAFQILGLAASGFLLWKIASNPEVRSGLSRLFILQDLRVNSPSNDVESRVRQKLKNNIGFGLYELDLDDIQQKIAEIPRVESVEVFRRWPDTLIVNIVEKTPVALAFRGNRLMLISKDGDWMEELSRPLGLPILKNADQEDFPLKDVCNWLFAVQSAGDNSYLSFSKIDEVLWSLGHGLIIRSASLDLKVSLGHGNFEERWQTAIRAYTHSFKKGRVANWIDAYNPRRVILSGVDAAVATAVNSAQSENANTGSHTVF